ncbi:lysine biosynthesis protein LysW [Nonomuraea sp. NPDC052116]|uniref:lysine biosynthesis protein LysW n=1 Tax=Nonomuraea sp. NPDC052116 TaxID=3155665 RepID=UPI0034473992
MADCPECESGLRAEGSLRVHEIIECAECRAELEVVSLNPLLVALAPEIEEDWGE